MATERWTWRPECRGTPVIRPPRCPTPAPSFARWGVPGGGLALGPADTVLSAYAAGSQLAPGDSAHFGLVLAVGDFNGDGRDDLAVGASRVETGHGIRVQLGAVVVHYGLPNGIQTAGEHFLMEGTNGVPNEGDGVAYPGAAPPPATSTAMASTTRRWAAAERRAGDRQGDRRARSLRRPDSFLRLPGAPGLGGQARHRRRKFDHSAPTLAAGNFDGDERCTDACRPSTTSRSALRARTTRGP